MINQDTIPFPDEWAHLKHTLKIIDKALDQTDRTGVFAAEVCDKMEKLKESPYFARIDFVSDGEEEVQISAELTVHFAND